MTKSKTNNNTISSKQRYRQECEHIAAQIKSLFIEHWNLTYQANVIEIDVARTFKWTPEQVTQMYESIRKEVQTKHGNRSWGWTKKEWQSMKILKDINE